MTGRKTTQVWFGGAMLGRIAAQKPGFFEKPGFFAAENSGTH